jgi:hypothetical protein
MSLFLSPADPVNAKRSLSTPVPLSVVRAALGDDAKYNGLLKDFGNERVIYCWAVRESKAGIFRKMSLNDDVIFSVKGTGKFNFHGKIVGKTESTRFAIRLWEDELLSNWQHIYFLKGIRDIAIDKSMMARGLGYDKADRFQGLRWVSPERFKEFSSVAELIDVLGGASKKALYADVDKPPVSTAGQPRKWAAKLG